MSPQMSRIWNASKVLWNVSQGASLSKDGIPHTEDDFAAIQYTNDFIPRCSIRLDFQDFWDN